MIEILGGALMVLGGGMMTAPAIAMARGGVRAALQSVFGTDEQLATAPIPEDLGTLLEQLP